LILAERIKRYQAGHVAITITRHTRRDDDRAACALRAGREVQGMETLHERRAAFLGPCDDV
jgi:hypothetical protein